MKIAICGADGFIGTRLSQHLTEHNNIVIPILREHLQQELSHGVHHDLQEIIDSCNVIINLAGESIDQRWTSSAKQRILESRVHTTRTIISAINYSKTPKLLINASAVGIYPQEGCHTDYSRLRGTSFLTDVCRAWEKEAMRLDPKHDLVITRFGVVFDMNGGALPKMLATKRFGFLARVGAPNRHLSWIDREDLVRAISHIIQRNDLRGIINLCAPEYTSQELFLSSARSSFMSVKCIITIPEFLLRLLRGEAAALIMEGQCSTPEKLLKSDFHFQSPTITQFFNNQA